MLTSDEKEADYQNTVGSHEGVPIRPHSDKLYPRVLANDHTVTICLGLERKPYVATREYAHKLHKQLEDALGITNTHTPSSVPHVSGSHRVDL